MQMSCSSGVMIASITKAGLSLHSMIFVGSSVNIYKLLQGRAVNSHALSVSLTPGLFLTLSRQAGKIPCMNAKHPAKHVKSHAQ